MTEAAEEIRAAADPEANIIFGTSFNERLGDEVQITVIATGFDANRQAAPASATRPTRPRPGRWTAAPAEPAASATSSRSSSASASPPATARSATGPGARSVPAAVGIPVVRSERSVGEAVPAPRRATVDADELEIPSFRRTEFLVERAVALHPRVLVDLCCGSGAIGAAVLAALGALEVHAADVDPAAVRCARLNVAEQVHQGDLYDALPRGSPAGSTCWSRTPRTCRASRST